MAWFGGPVSEIGQGWEEPETIRRTMVWPSEVERAVGAYALQVGSTPIEVITRLVREALDEQKDEGEHLVSGNGDRPRLATDATTSWVWPEGDEEPETIRRTMVWPFEVLRDIGAYAVAVEATPVAVTTRFVREALKKEGYFSSNGDRPNNAA